MVFFFNETTTSSFNPHIRLGLGRGLGLQLRILFSPLRPLLLPSPHLSNFLFLCLSFLAFFFLPTSPFSFSPSLSSSFLPISQGLPFTPC